MSTRRIAHWWFRLVFSGRFVATFIGGRHRRPLPPPALSITRLVDDAAGDEPKTLDRLVAEAPQPERARQEENPVGLPR
jgi:hypothetical protein